MKLLMIICVLLLGGRVTHAAETAEEIQNSVLFGAQIANSVRVFTPLRPTPAQPDTYLVPRFGVYVGGTRVTDSSPDSVLLRLFSATGIWKDAKALAITVQFSGMPEIPVLAVNRTGNSFKQASIHNVPLTPSLQYPGTARVMTVRYRYSTETTTDIAKLMAAATEISTAIAGAPVAFLANPLVTKAGKEIDTILAAAFKVDQSYSFEIGLNTKLIQHVERLELVYYDRAFSNPSATPIATLVIALDMEKSLFHTPDSKGQFPHANEGQILNGKLGREQSAYDYLKANSNAFVSMIGPNATPEQYYAGCDSIRIPISVMGLTPPDQSMLMWAAAMSSPAKKSDKCPTSSERKKMSTLGLPAIEDEGQVGGDYAVHYKPTLDTLVNVFKNKHSLTSVANDDIRIYQTAQVLPDVPLNSQQYLSPNDVDAKLSKLTIPTCCGWGAYNDGVPGEFLLTNVIIDGKKYHVLVRMQIVQVAAGPPAVRKALVTRLSFQPGF